MKRLITKISIAIVAFVFVFSFISAPLSAAEKVHGSLSLGAVNHYLYKGINFTSRDSYVGTLALDLTYKNTTLSIYSANAEHYAEQGIQFNGVHKLYRNLYFKSDILVWNRKDWPGISHTAIVLGGEIYNDKIPGEDFDIDRSGIGLLYGSSSSYTRYEGTYIYVFKTWTTLSEKSGKPVFAYNLEGGYNTHFFTDGSGFVVKVGMNGNVYLGKKITLLPHFDVVIRDGFDLNQGMTVIWVLGLKTSYRLF